MGSIPTRRIENKDNKSDISIDQQNIVVDTKEETKHILDEINTINTGFEHETNTIVLEIDTQTALHDLAVRSSMAEPDTSQEHSDDRHNNTTDNQSNNVQDLSIYPNVGSRPQTIESNGDTQTKTEKIAKTALAVAGAVGVGYGIYKIGSWIKSLFSDEEAKETDEEGKEPKESSFSDTISSFFKGTMLAGGAIALGGFLSKYLGLGSFFQKIPALTDAKEIVGGVSEEVKVLQEKIQKYKEQLLDAKGNTKITIARLISSLEKKIKKLQGQDDGADDDGEAGTEENEEKKLIEEVEELTQDQLEKVKKNTMDYMATSLGRPIDKQKFDKGFGEWSARWKQELGEITKVNGSWNLLDKTIDIVALPTKMMFDFFMTMQSHEVITLTEVGLEFGSSATDGMIQYGLRVPQLFGKGISFVMGQISLEEVSKFVDASHDSLSSESRMQLRATMYRYGGMTKNIMEGIGKVTGLAMQFLLEGGSQNIGKFEARLAGMTGDITKQIDIITKLEDALGVSKVHGSVSKDILSKYTEAIQTIKSNTIIFGAMQEASTYGDLKRILDKSGHGKLWDDFLSEMSASQNKTYLTGFVGDVLDMNAKIGPDRGQIGNLFKSLTNGKIDRIKGAIGKGKGIMSGIASHFRLTSKAGMWHYLDDTVKHLQVIGDAQETLLQDNKMFSDIKNILAKNRIGKQMVKMLEQGDTMRLYISNVEEATDFFTNIKTLSREMPGVVGMLAKSLPMIFIGGEVANSIEEGGDVGKKIGLGFLSLVPFAGPIMLIHGALEQEGEFDVSRIDVGQAGIGVGLLGLDGFTGFKKVFVGPGSRLKNTGEFFTQPIADAISFTKGITYDAPRMAFKMGRDLSNTLKHGGRDDFWKECKIYAKGGGKRALMAVAVGSAMYGGYKIWDHSNEFDAKEKETMDKLSADQNAYNAYIREHRAEFDTQEKEFVLRMAYAYHAQLDTSDINVVYKDGKYTCLVDQLLSKQQVTDAKDRIQESLTYRGSSDTIVVGLSRSLKNSLVDHVAQQTGQSDIAQGDIEQYLKQLGYTQDDIQGLTG